MTCGAKIDPRAFANIEIKACSHWAMAPRGIERHDSRFQVKMGLEQTETEGAAALKITVLCSDRKHPIFPVLENWCARVGSGHEVKLVTDKQELERGDLLFLISCHQIIRKSERDLFHKTLVIHASDLPRGKGWSPYIWQILEGQRQIVVTLLEAEDKVDSGDIWKKTAIEIGPGDLHDEIHRKLFAAELELMDFAVENFATIAPLKQDPAGETFYPKRSPNDSRLDPAKTLAEQFDILRVSDPQRYPAFFELHGQRYLLKIEKVESEP